MSSDHSSSRNIKAGVVITYLTQFLSIAISFFYVPIMLRMLGQEEYGLYALVQSLISFLQMSEMGVGITATRYNAKYIAEGDVEGQRSINGMFRLLYIGIGVVCLIAGMIVYRYIPQWYDHYSEESISLIRSLFLLALANLCFTLFFKIYNSIIIAYENFIFLKVLTLITTILGPVSMLCVLYLGYRAVGMVAATTVITILSGLVQLVYCRTKLKIRFSYKHFDKKIFISIFAFTAFVFLNSIAHQLFSNSDKFIISLLMTETAVAIYAIVIQFQVYFYNFANVISSFYLPRFTKIVKGAKAITAELMSEVVRTARLQVIIAGLIFGGFLALGYPFIIRWVGTEYEQAYILTVIIMAGEYICSCQSMFNSLMQAMNLHKFRAVLSLIAAVIKIGITILMVKWLGLTGCAIAYFAAIMIRLVLYNLYYKYVGIDIKDFWITVSKVFLPITLIIIIIFGLFKITSLYLDFNNYGFIILFAILYLILYIGAIWRTCLNDYERGLLIGVKDKVVRRFKK